MDWSFATVGKGATSVLLSAETPQRCARALVGAGFDGSPPDGGAELQAAFEAVR